MPPATALRPVTHPALRLRSHSFTQHRFAQTALRSDDEPHLHASTSHSHPHHRPEPASHPRKGKHRESPIGQQYRFPQTGKHGGPPDPFEVLGVERSASDKEVKQQYYRLALILHPDSAHPASSPTHFATLHRAYALLSHPASRLTYLRSGLGWTKPNAALDHPVDSMMREVMRRGQAGAGFRPSDAGKGAWGGRGGTHQWRAYGDAGFHGDVATEPTLMSHHRFLGLFSLVLGIGAWVQYHRIDMVADSRREMLDQSHLNASHALAAARKEASLHGHERREQMRRKINEARVLKEVEEQEQDGISAQ
ncbi:MAG: hypothetical protein TREMPRED_001287 [Tremellales sp. Tagirdzhanova-0007]|nr:MAG: hypothetical protein TREMPRED_001287 [Tremellales sp. Tagirdzhanova-0007]